MRRVAAVVAPAAPRACRTDRSPVPRSPRCHDRHEAVIPHRAVECDRRDAADSRTGSGPRREPLGWDPVGSWYCPCLSLSGLLSLSLLLVPELMSPHIGHLAVQAADILERMQPVLGAKWIAAGWFARRPFQTARHGVRQCPPVERIPFRDQRDVTWPVVLIIKGNAARCNSSPSARASASSVAVTR